MRHYKEVGKGRLLITQKRIFYLFFLFFLCTKIFPGAEPLSLSLEEAVSRALAQSLNLQKSAIDLELAQYRADRLWAELFPVFNLRAGLTLLPETPLFTSPGFQYNQDGASYSFSLGVSFQFNGGMPYAMKITELAYRRGLLDYESAKRRVEIDIAKSFYTLLAGRENIAHLVEIFTLSELQLEKNSIARANGLIGELPWLQSRLSLETARYNLNNAQVSYDNSLKDFLTTLGMDRNIEVFLEGSINPVPIELNPEALILEYLPKRPDIISQRQTIERLELVQKQGVFSSKAPSVSLSAQWSAGPERNSGFSGTFTDSLSGSLSISIPIDPWIPGTKSNQTLMSANAELEKARLDLLNTEIAAKSQIRSLSDNLRNSWRSIEIARLRVEIAQRTYQITEAGFQSGTVEFLSLENTRNDLADARFRLLQSELAYHNVTLDLAAALNLDPEALARSKE